MAGDEGWDHDEKESNCQGNDSEHVGVQADESVSCEEGQGVSRASPGEEADQAILEDEDYTDASVEASKVDGHQRKGEGRSFGIFGGATVDGSIGVNDILGWNDLG